MDVYIDRGDLRRGEIVEVHMPALEPGQVLLAVDAFALTANNVTYAAIGDMLRYWEFFPAPAPWGRVPVWGFADVVESASAEVAVGTRVYGYLPMSDELVVTPGRVGPDGFSDVAPHRAAMAAAYSRYQIVPTGADRDLMDEARRMLLFPLFFTSFLIDGALADRPSAANETVVLSSASSKTAIGTAFQVRARGVPVIGLTSPANLAFVTGLDLYDQVLTYDQVRSGSAELDAPAAVYVDIAGNAAVTAAVHGALGDRLAASLIVGDTHWDDAPETAADLEGPAPTFFFAPDQIAARAAEWGRAGLDERVDAAWTAFTTWADGWLTITRRSGPESALATFVELVDNQADPSEGFVISMGSART